MYIQDGDVAIARIGDTLDLATWNVERTTEQLLTFIATKQAALPDTIEL